MMRIYASPENVKEVTLRLLAMRIDWYIERFVLIKEAKPMVMIIALPDDEGEKEDLRAIGFSDYSVM